MKPKCPPIGTVVTVNKILIEIFKSKEPGYRANLVTWEPRPITPRAGFIVGYRTLQNGEISHGSYYGDEYEQGYRDVTSTQYCWLVVYWPNRKPIHVRPEDCVMGGTPVSDIKAAMLVFQTQRPEEYSRYRNCLSNEAKRQHRDSRGRFIKETR